jgi:hypothetical protein
MSAPNWPKAMRGPMDALSEAKAKGHVRAVGCSLHVHPGPEAAELGPLRAAVAEPWGDVVLVRLNPFAVNTDVADPDSIPGVEKILKAMHRRGKALYGMKLLGGTDPHLRKSRLTPDQYDRSLRFALSRPYLSGFTIGLSRERDVDDIIRRIERIACPMHLEDGT